VRRKNRNITVALMLVLFALALPVALIMTRGDKAAEPNPDCTSDPNLRIKVGSTILSVPRRYSPIIHEFFGKNLGSPKKICQLAHEPAIEAGGLTFNFTGKPPNTEAQDPITLPIWHAQIEIVRRPNPFTAPERMYNLRAELIESLGGNLTELKRRHGFLVFDGFPNDRRIYIALPDTVESLDPAPFVVECSAPIPHYASDRINYGRPCHTTYYSIVGSLVGLYKFYEGQTPLAEFSKLDDSVRAFVKSLVIDGG
jgi:hypothetical protein